MDRVLNIRSECYADDVDITEELIDWSDEALREYFEHGGVVSAPATASTVGGLQLYGNAVRS